MSLSSGPNGSTTDNAGPRRKMSIELSRIKNFPSSLSLRKSEPESPATPSITTGTFSRLRNFGQGQVRHAERSSSGITTGNDLQKPSMPSYSSESSLDSKSVKRSSRFLDAFRPSRKQTPTFEVIRKPPNRSTTSFQSASVQSSPQAPIDLDGRASRISGQYSDLTETPAPRISLSIHRPESSASQADAGAFMLPSDHHSSRPPYPPSTSKTRRLSSTRSATLGRRISDTFPIPASNSNSNSRAHSPTSSQYLDATGGGSFSLHSFRNVRSGSDASRPDDSGHSRVHSIISVEEYATPKEELPEPRLLSDATASPSSSLPLASPIDETTIDASRTRSVSPASNFGSSNATKPASISAAKFRQAARQRSESGTLSMLEAFPNGAPPGRPPRSRTPSQNLAMMEAVLAESGGSRPSRPVSMIEDQRKALADQPVLHIETKNELTAAAPLLSVRRQRGLFIVVEGLDRAGKSTQVERLAQHLHAKAIKFPERTTAIGQMINSYLAQTSDLDDQAIHLLFSANRWECVSSIKKSLGEGQNIVCDRYAFSGIAYSVAKGLAYDWCRNPDVGLPLPDLTLFLNLDAETAAARGGYGEERYEKLEFQAKVRQAFNSVSKDVQSHGGRWATIDASKELEEVTQEIQDTVQRAIASIEHAGGSELGKLFMSATTPIKSSTPASQLSSSVLPGQREIGQRGIVTSSDNSRESATSAGPVRETLHANGKFPATRPNGSPMSYSEQLAAVRAAAAGSLSGLFGAPAATVGQQLPQQRDGPSLTNSARGQGIDSTRALASYQDDGTGKRRTLMDVLGQMENQPKKPEHRRSISGAANVDSPTTSSPSDGFPSTFALARARRSTELSRTIETASATSSGVNGGHVDASEDSPIDDRGSLQKIPPLINPNPKRAAEMPSPEGIPSGATDLGRPVASPSPNLDVPNVSHRRRSGDSSRLSVHSGTNGNASADPQFLRVRTSSPSVSGSTGMSPSTSPASASASPAPRTSTNSPLANVMDLGQQNAAANANAYQHQFLNAQQLALLHAQQGQAEFQEQYMRNYMAMMANPMLAQQAQYQMMLQRHQQQYFGRAASAIGFSSSSAPGASGSAAGGVGGATNGNGIGAPGGPPTATFMQPGSQVFPPAAGGNKSDVGYATSLNRERRRSHQRSQSSSSLMDGTSPTNAPPHQQQVVQQQPMLSMMLAPPPASSSPHPASIPAQAAMQQQHPFYAQHPAMFYGQAGYGSMSGFAPNPYMNGSRPFYHSAHSDLNLPSSAAAAAAAAANKHNVRSRRSIDHGLRTVSEQGK